MTASTQSPPPWPAAMLTLQHHLPKFQSLREWQRCHTKGCESFPLFHLNFSAVKTWQKANRPSSRWSRAVSPGPVIISTNHNTVCEGWWIFSTWWFPAPSGDQVTASKAPAKPKSKEAAAKKAPAAKKPAAAKKKAAGDQISLAESASAPPAAPHQHGQSWCVCSGLSDVKQPSIVVAFSKPKASSVTSVKRVPSFDSSDSEAGAKAAAKKFKPACKRKQIDSDDSDSDSGNLMSRLKAKALGRKASSELARWAHLRSVIMKLDRSLTFSSCSRRIPRSTWMMKPSTFPTRRRPSRWSRATTPHVHANLSPTTLTQTRMKTFKCFLFSFLA